ncbi:ABC-type sugar transport system substrate-binding protein [Kibdelosporangium banguiense]|uniref:ABC-type sugar transport system substrate-binding protein n=1 Tax=Kibdelosporangium banguiense TaxID=1365924 RepID=A0ABS4TGU7_9PSEU|nr:hypothetical protein [Kibdelosporangium banguiense]MBP2323650.1 ABC-type sugar transport system substrate-binding protein [Kibdelosporangium banguiense]
MRKTLTTLAFAGLFVLGATPATAAGPPYWNGPYDTQPGCIEARDGWREAGGVAGGCTYKEVPSRGNGYYFSYWPMP